MSNYKMGKLSNKIILMKMTEKELFIESLKKRIKKLAIDVIIFCDSLKVCKASSIVIYQLVKAATSTGANYRAACRARSKAEFFSKICIVVEEADELRANTNTIFVFTNE